jgi:hypothetical protein
MATIREDRFTIWPTALACFFPLILIILRIGRFDGQFGLAIVGELVVLMTWVCSALLAFFLMLSARTGDWRRAVSMSVLPLATLVVIAGGGGRLVNGIGDRIHFQAMRRSYLEDMSKLPSSGEPRFAVWDWGPLEPLGLTLVTLGFRRTTPLSTTRAMKSCCRCSGQLGGRGWQVAATSHRVVYWNRWAITSISSGMVAEPFTGTTSS